MKSCTLFEGILPRSGRNWSLQTSGHTWGYQAVPQCSDRRLCGPTAAPRGTSCAAGARGGRNYPKHSYSSAPLSELTLAPWGMGRRRPRPLSGCLSAPEVLTPHIPGVRSWCFLKEQLHVRGGTAKYPNLPDSEHSPALPAVP